MSSFNLRIPQAVADEIVKWRVLLFTTPNGFSDPKLSEFARVNRQYIEADEYREHFKELDVEVNRQVKLALTPKQRVTGYFVERDVGNSFHYKTTDDVWALRHGLQFEIEMPNTQEKRFARILKTVLYIAVDEDAMGSPVLQKWHIRNHKVTSQ